MILISNIQFLIPNKISNAIISKFGHWVFYWKPACRQAGWKLELEIK